MVCKREVRVMMPAADTLAGNYWLLYDSPRFSAGILSGSSDLALSRTAILVWSLGQFFRRQKIWRLLPLASSPKIRISLPALHFVFFSETLSSPQLVSSTLLELGWPDYLTLATWLYENSTGVVRYAMEYLARSTWASAQDFRPRPVFLVSRNTA